MKENAWIWCETLNIVIDNLLIQKQLNHIFRRPCHHQICENICFVLSSFLIPMKSFLSLFWILDWSCPVLLDDQGLIKTSCWSDLCLMLFGPHEDGHHLKRHREHNRWVLLWDFNANGYLMINIQQFWNFRFDKIIIIIIIKLIMMINLMI